MKKNSLHPLKHLRTSALALAALCGSALTPAHAQSSDEDEFKAAMIFNFLRFTSWQDTSNMHSPDQVHICVNDHDGLPSAVRRLNGKSLGERSISVLTIDTPEELPGYCDVVILTEEFMSRGTVSAHRNILFISEKEGLATELASIELVNIGRKTRFHVRPTVARENGIFLSAKLINVAAKVW